MGVTPTSCQFIHPHIMVPILQSPGLSERPGEARRADSASNEKAITKLEIGLHNKKNKENQKSSSHEKH